MTSNFAFLQDMFPVLANLGSPAKLQRCVECIIMVWYNV